MAMAASMARPSCWNDSACCVAAPPMVAITPGGKVVASRRFWTSAVSDPKELLSGATETVAVRWPLEEVMDNGTWTSSTVATAESGTGPEAVGIWAAARAAIESNWVPRPIWTL